MIQVTWTKEDHIALAVSGGVDSMVLLHLLLTEYEDTYQSLTLLHVNHGLRLASADEAAFIESLAEQHEKMLYTTRLSLSAEDFTQETARTARYEFFFNTMRDKKIVHLLTGHHKDDDIETLMNQVLSARPPLGILSPQTHGSFTLHRPLLNQSKRDIYAYAKKENVIYFEDASNQENDYTRNYIRNKVIPVIDNHSHLSSNRLLQLKSDYEDFLHICETKFKSLDTQITRQTLVGLTLFEQAFVLRKLSGDMNLSRTYIEEIVKVAMSDTANAKFKTNEHPLVIAYDMVFAMTETESASQLHITERGQYEFNGYKISIHSDIVPLHVRTFKPGDAMRLDFGVKKVARIFIDEKIPKHLRARIPIVENVSGEIIAVGTIYNIIERKLLKIEREASHDTEK